MLNDLRFRLRALFRRSQVEHELDDELRFHLERETAKHMARGLSQPEAARAARVALGASPEAVKERVRDQRGSRWLEEWVQDLRYGARTLRLSRGFTLVALLTLALGIGVNTATFQLLETVFLRPLASVRDPATLAVVQIHGGNKRFGVVDSDRNLTWPLYQAIREDQRVFSHLFAWSAENIVGGIAPETRPLRGIYVSGSYFAGLQLTPAAGRLLEESDDRVGCASPGVVLSHAFWRREYGGAPSVIGQRLVLLNRPLSIVGVAPAGFAGLEVGQAFDVALPLCAKDLTGEGRAYNERPDVFWLDVMGRLKPGVTRAQAAAQLRALSPGLFHATKFTNYPPPAIKIYQQFTLDALPGQNGVSDLRARFRLSLLLLLGITGLILLIACANVANLMLARAMARRREFAIRMALGGARSRLLRQALTEGILLAGIGGIAGLGLAHLLSRILTAKFAVSSDAPSLDLTLDWRVLAFAAGSSLAACLAFALVPALRSLRTTDPGDALKSGGGRSLTPDRQRFAFQRTLIVVQVSTSLVLITGALLLVGTYRNLIKLDPGFRIHGILLAQFDLSHSGLPSEAIKPAVQRILDEVRATPRVEAAAATTNVLINGGSWTLGLTGGRTGASQFTWVSPGHFTTIESPILRGRDFTAEDVEHGPGVVIVNEAFAQKYFPGVDPLGKTFRTAREPGYPEAEYRIVGVCRNTRYSDLRNTPPPQCFAPLTQHPSYGPSATLYVRSSAPLAELSQELKRRIQATNPRVSVDFRVFENEVQDSLMRERLLAWMSGFFGLLATLLASIGLYGVMAYIVSGRRAEIGLRIALGATSRQVARLILQETATLTVFGMIVGIVGALVFARTAQSLLFGLSLTDPVLYIVAFVILFVVAALGSYLPTRRATRMNPVSALRHE